jgi:outer membrane protein
MRRISDGFGRRALGGLFVVAMIAPQVARAEPAATAVALAEDGTCDLATCVRLALARAPSVKAAEARIAGAEAAAAGTRSNLGPKLKIDGGVQVWDSELSLNFGGFPGLPIEIPPTVIREQVTWSVNLTLAQPLMGLWTIFEAAELQSLGIDAARLEAEGETRRLAQEAAEAWLQAALATRLVEVAEVSLASRENDRNRAKAFVDGGVIVAAELTRAELGVTQARQLLSQARRQEALARARLSQLVGRSARPTRIELPALKVVPPVESLAVARQRAIEQRTELQTLQQQLNMASQAVDVEVTQLMPNVNLVAQAQFIGGSELQANQQAFVGVTFDWTFWEWGSRYHKMDELRARVREVRERMQQLTEGLQLEVEAAWIAWASSVEQAELAAAAEDVAATNYELAQKRFESKTITSFELTEAESALTKARMDKTIATTAALVARAQLVRAMGGTSDAIIGEATP